MITAHDLLAAWNAFFFRPEPVATFALFRFAFGLLIVANAALLACEARLWFGPAGLFGAEAFRRTPAYRRSIFRWLPQSDASAFAVLALSGAAGVCLAVGLAPRVAAAVVFLTLLALHQRNSAITHSGDAVLRLMSFLLIFAPAARPFDLAASAEPWAIRLMQIQVGCLYLRTGFEKVQGKTWRNGTAAHWPLVVQHYQRFRLPEAARHPLLVRAATWGTLILEIALGTAIWIDELRYPLIVLGMALHLMIEIILELQLFGITMIVCLMLFVPPSDLLRWIGT